MRAATELIVGLDLACRPSGNVEKIKEIASSPPNPAKEYKSCASKPFFNATSTSGEQHIAPTPQARFTRLTSDAMRVPPISATVRFVGGTTRPDPIPRAASAK